MMSLANVTQRRPRKSLLGTHRTKRESILPVLSDTLYNIYEEKKDSEDPEALSIPHPEKCEESHPTIFYEEAMVADSASVAFEDTSHDLELCHSSPSKDHSPLRKRLDSLFSPAPINDDSFVIHETMLAFDDSVLATTLKDISPEANRDPVIDNPDVCSLMDNVTVIGSIRAECDEIEHKSVICDDKCDSRDDETRRVVERMIQFLDSQMKEKNEVRIACIERITEMQKKVDESKAEIEDIEKIKKFLLAKFSSESEKENVEPTTVSAGSTLPNEISPSNLVQEVRSKVKSMKTPRHCRKPRESALLTPHTMSFCVKSQFENLLNGDFQVNEY